MDGRTEAPWTDEAVRSLNGYQRSGVMHPFTCGGDHKEHVLLVADNDGWWCPTETCDYTQGWAHTFMANGSWRDLKRSMDELLHR